MTERDLLEVIGNIEYLIAHSKNATEIMGYGTLKAEFEQQLLLLRECAAAA